jgi:hypothetical protein
MVGDRGLEPPTSRSQTARASQLRQSPFYKHLTDTLGYFNRLCTEVTALLNQLLALLIRTYLPIKSSGKNCT